MKILYIVNIPSPYRVAYFNELGKMSELEVVFERRNSSERDDSWNDYEFEHFKGVFCKGKKIGVDMAVSLTPIKYLRRNRKSWIIVGNAMSLSGLLEVAYMKVRGIPFWIEGDGAFSKEEKKIKYWIKKFMLSGADGYLSTCKNHDDYYAKYGINPTKIYRYPFSSLKKSDVLDKPIDRAEKRIIRKELGMPERYIIISVGQFIHRKGFDLLVEASKVLGSEVGIYLIGGEKIENLGNNKQVHVLPFKQSKELLRYYDAADLFVLPTREDIWGLVINEAMARGLPIITTDRCNAGLELVKDGENGYIVRADDAKELTEKIHEVLANSDMESMGRKSLAYIREYTINDMAERHIQIYQEAFK